MSPVWDAAVVGAGPAGATAAYVLAQAGRRVLLVDPVRAGGRKIGESLPGVARPLLAELGLLSLVENDSHLPYFGNVSAWGASELAATDFIHDPYGAGWRLDRPKFDADLRAAVQDSGGSLWPARVQTVTSTGDGWRIRLANGEIDTHWLIDATGRRALAARHCGATRQRDDSLVALAAWVTPPETDVDTRTLVESTPDGWWYTALLPNRTRVVVFHADPEEAASILHRPGVWEQRLAHSNHVRHLLANAAFVTTPQGMEACGARLDQFAGKGWLATGDAALSFDPLSSQGIFNALYTGMKAGHTVHAALSQEPDAVARYIARLEAIRSRYLHHHHLIYQTERRWRDRPFWARRQLRRF
jgi:flavin-dependent dehydrogenase